MQRYLAQRLSVSLVVIFGVTLVAFLAIQFIPADAVDLMLGLRKTPESEAALREKLGLDKPPVEQYFTWMGKILQGDLGNSIRSDQPISEAIQRKLPVTLELAVLASFVAIIIGIPGGIIAAVRQYSTTDQVSTVISMIGLSIPDFWLATLLILLFSVTWKLMPPGGLWVGPFEDLGQNLKRLLMPVLSMGLPAAAIYFRITRSSMLEVIRSDYMVTAYSKGVKERRAIFTHALKNALIPVVTMSSMEFTYLLGGSFIIESIFSLPGLGRITLEAIYERDYILLQGCLLVYATMVVTVYIFTDLLYVWLDPRIRLD
jgi:peptide/nickel transport system permease protein